MKTFHQANQTFLRQVEITQRIKTWGKVLTSNVIPHQMGKAVEGDVEQQQT